MTETMWEISWRTDVRARVLADRHYNRQKIGADGFVPPGRCLVLLGVNQRAFWVTSWPFAEYVKHQWAGAWVCSAFRNEGEGLSSELIRSALAATLWRWPDPPLVQADGTVISMVTFVDPTKVKQKHPKGLGRCYRMAGFEVVGETKGGLLALGIRPEHLPEAAAPRGTQSDFLFEPETAA